MTDSIAAKASTIADKATAIMAQAAEDGIEEVKELTHEGQSEAHQLFRSHPGHQHSSSSQSKPHKVPGVVVNNATGMIYMVDRAMANGYTQGNPEWAQLAQGAPETGHIDGAVEKPTTLDLASLGDDVHEYGPTAGIKPLREAVADYYNREFRRPGGKKEYSWKNVCIVPGGRAGLSRIAAVLGQINLGYTVPVYSAYSNLLETFAGSFVPIPNMTDEEHGYKLTAEQIRKQIRDLGLSAFLLSNPANPTGTHLRGKELAELVDIGRDLNCSMILDEFYSWYDMESPELGKAISAAEYVDDPEEDPVMLIDGLTKNWRCPGWRCCWVVGPSQLIAALGAAGSFLDGGASHPIQNLAVQMLDADRVTKDRLALQQHFRTKRAHVLKRLDEMGLQVKVPPQATFYIWANLAGLPKPISSGLVFAEEALKEKVLVVPGTFFDLNPAKRRNIVDSPCETFSECGLREIVARRGFGRLS